MQLVLRDAFVSLRAVARAGGELALENIRTATVGLAHRPDGVLKRHSSPRETVNFGCLGLDDTR